jgi:AbrB family looped-hinge helix DNA binding protein
MATTRLSTKGQIVIPKAIREAGRWPAGTEFVVSRRGTEIILAPASPGSATTRVEDVFGRLKLGRALPTAEIERAVENGRRTGFASVDEEAR